ncbi:O-antigen ligase family protein [Alienimonas chondri]|uniref:O-antigen ligase-related domain-containing protein n=1 Tax=Alienimonas chondri TaxID=2681879 RepID=A0ABX1VCG7_9PLAN|nr:O-antigen ligase family protein [Alienimonas chondri]NNJ25582.1 hypothetical protein [Alienimonas chondri]
MTDAAATTGAAAPARGTGDRWKRWMRAAVGLSLAGRFLVPTEATLLGLSPGDAAADGWFSAIALLALSVWAGRAWWSGASQTDGVRWGRCETLLAAVVLAHGLAAAPIFWEGGPRRAAAETVFNWAGLVAAAVLLRSVWRPGDSVRFAALVVACGTAAAVVGVWQVTVSLPASRAEYLDLREREAGSDSRARTTARARLAAMNVPEEPAARKRWEDRLLGSREPFGPYSLANTLAGVLLAAALLLPALVQRIDRSTVAAIGLVAALLVGVLLLTKSRTGYVGLTVGGLMWAGLRWGRGAGRGAQKKAFIGAAIAGGLLIAGVTAAVWLGQLDREVISEAPRSLAFRLQYWAGTLRALADRPLLGTGPANLRPFYLLHKDAAASEAIAAPHNLILDLWTSGGLLAPLLAAALAWCGVRRWRTPPPSPRAAEGAPPGWDSLFTGTLAAFGLVGAFGGLLGPIADVEPGLNPWIYAMVRGWDAHSILLLAAIPAAGVLWFAGRSAGGPRSTGPAWAAACVGLAVHLLGADGAEFPAIVAVFLLALAAPPPRVVPDDLASVSQARRDWLSPAICLTSGLLAAVGVWFVLLPGREAGALLETARAESARGRDPRGTLLRAMAADPLSDSPLAASADLATVRSLADPTDAGARRKAVGLWNDLLQRRPGDGRAYERISDLHRAAGDWGEAVEADRAAARLDPSAAAPQARLAVSADRAGDRATARAAAEAALERDAITRDAGHRDRVLPDETTANLRSLLRSGD